MKMREFASFLKNHSAIIITSLLILLVAGCAGKTREGTVPEGKSKLSISISDRPLPAFQYELLDLAFDTATALPVKPHIKTRSKTQESVVEACLKLNQPQRALVYTERIENWRQGSCYAGIAFYCVEHDCPQIESLLGLADTIAMTASDWRRDRIRARIAKTHTLLGQQQKADHYSANATDSETGKVAEAKAMIADEQSFEKQMKDLDELIAQGNFDITKNAIKALARLYHRFYDDSNLRSRAEQKIRDAWEKMPVIIRIDMLITLAKFSSDHSDQNKSIALINEAHQIMNQYSWYPEKEIPLKAKLALEYFQAGDHKAAKSLADETLQSFYEQRDKIFNIYRADALRPLAEAYQSMGEREAALSIYKLSVKEGTENPNSRPRAEDLTATCCSMAISAFEPDTELWKQLHQIYEGLGQPW